MSSEPFKVKTAGSRTRSVTGSRRQLTRSAALRRLTLDSLEPRTLMAVLPTTPFNASTVNISGQESDLANSSSPSIAIDQNNPSKMAAVWTVNDPRRAPGPTEVVQFATSVDGGKSWLSLGTGGFLQDPTSTTFAILPQYTDASVAFDRNDNFYILYSAHKTDTSAGALLLSKYNFSTGQPQSVISNKAVYEWVADQAINPMLTVDDSVPTFSDTDVNGVVQTQNDPNSGNVYVAWESSDVAPKIVLDLGSPWNPNRIRLMASTDGGATFSGQQVMNLNNNSPNGPGGRLEATPRLTISQGAAPRAPQTNGASDPGSPGVKPGTVSVVWDDHSPPTVPPLAPPQTDSIYDNRITDTNVSQSFTSNGGTIVPGGAGTPNVPFVNTYPINVNVTDPRFFSVSDLTVQLALVHNQIGELQIILVPPTGSNLQPITLLNNQTDAAGVTRANIGAAGANLGIAPDGEALGTTFDDNASRDIVDIGLNGSRGAAAPFVGNFKPEASLNGATTLNGLYGGAIAGAPNSPNSVNGTWTLQITDFRTNTNPNFVRYATINLNSGLRPQVETLITNTFAYALQTTQQITSLATAQGLAPDPTIASDNTLGAYSPFEGRLYVAFLDRLQFINNPPDNTDIFLATSDDGGITWTRSNLPVNDDNALKDGYTEGSGGLSNTGRPQFQPSVAVDNTTGTLVMSWLDTRDDASRARIADYMTTSIDGGQTFSQDVFANDAQSATDAITDKKVVLQPILDNQSPGNPQTEPVAGYGTHQGLAVYGGIAHPVWASNLNGGTVKNVTTQLNIRTNAATFADGPRILSTTMGPIGEPNDSVNNSRATDGTPIANAFQVTFDRPVDPATFQPNDVRVLFRDTTSTNLTGGFVPITSVLPLNPGPFGATLFQVNFAPRTGVGTYSMEITAADISDRMRVVKSVVVKAGNAATSTSTDVPKTIIANGTQTSVIPVSGFAANQVVDNVTVTVSITAPDASGLTLTLISPSGTPIVLANHAPFTFAGGQNFTNTTFDDSAALGINQGFAPFTGSFRPASPLNQLVSQSINGNWFLEVQSSQTPLTATLTGWSVSITPGVVTTQQIPGNKLDQNSNAISGQANDFYAAPTPLSLSAPFTGPFSQDTLPLILPGPHVASTRVPGAPVTADNLVLNGQVNAIDVTFDRDMDPSTITPATILRIMGPTGPITGPFTILKNPQGSDPDPLHPRTYRIGFPTQSLSGTYTITLASTIADSHGNMLDTNLNAGVDLLKGTVTGTTVPITYNAPLGAAIPAGKTIVSTLNVPDNFLAQGVTVQLSITHPNDPDLQITLVSPDGIPVVLVPYGTGATGTHANFSGTIFDDAAGTPIQNGGPPFFGSFQPLQPLSVLNGLQAAGTWKLVVSSNPSANDGLNGSLTSWSVIFQKGVPSSGLGEPVADQASLSFRIFTMDPTNRLASTTWTAVGPASTIQTGVTNGYSGNNGYAGQIGGIAVDPSDPSGNTVYVAGASGGVWKTSDFLTNDPKGPTYIPLTDFGPNAGINIGSIAVFARNSDPRQSIVIAGTGFGDSTYGYGSNTSTGVGFIISKDGGATWSLLDSTNNTLPFGLRDHLFAVNGGTSTMKVVVDPNPTPTGNVIVYAAMKGPNGGLWRSVDTGNTWQKMSSAALGDATDVVLDYNSNSVNAVNNPTGNVNIIYAAFPGSGVYISPNRGQVLNQMVGGGVDPLIFDTITQRQVPVNNAVTPTGVAGGGRIVLAKPALFPSTAAKADLENLLYEGWLYAAIAGPDGHLDGVYLTKDFGQTWTKLQFSTLPDNNLVPRLAAPSNNFNSPNVTYDVLGSRIFPHGNYDMALTVDPNNPNLIYLGGTADGNDTGLIRIDTSAVFDSHAVSSYDSTRPDGGQLQLNTTGRTVVDDTKYGPAGFVGTSSSFGPFGPYINLLQDPTRPFLANSTVFVQNVSAFTNDGTGLKWIPVDQLLKSTASDAVPSSNIHRVVSLIDPLTGRSRLIFGDDEGVFTGVVLPDGSLDMGIGNAPAPTYSRNGNLQIAQFFYGAAQPSSALLNSQVASALFYGTGLGIGMNASDSNVLNNGQIVGQGLTSGATLGIIGATSGDQAMTGVGVDQQGNNIVYRYVWPGNGGNVTDFFQVSVGGGPFISRTSGLVQTSNDPQWPQFSPIYANGLPFGNFAVNPINGSQVMISSNAGRIFATSNGGQFWLSIGEPGSLDGSYAPALTFGAPDPKAPGGIGNLNNFLYAGTVAGHIFVSQTGGGGNLGAWTSVSSGLDGSPVVKIVTDPTRGSHDAYAVTQKGVYYITDSLQVGAAWQNITGNLFALSNSQFGTNSLQQTALSYLTSIQADWRYVIPIDPKNPTAGTHPVLYVSGEAGVFRSLDNGATWSTYPSMAFDGSAVDGGYLPNAHVTDLSVSLGKVDPTTGRAIAVAGDPNVLLASTYGRGQFAIRLAPIVFPTSIALDTKLPAPSGSNSGGTDANGHPIVTVAQPVIDGLSEQTAFGNTVRISILDLTDPTNPHVIGGFDPANPATDVPANYTDSAGHFQVQVSPTGFTTNGPKTIGIMATDASGTQGNIATLLFTLNAKLVSQTAPATPSIGLNPLDDTSGGLNITRNTSPRLIGTTDPGTQVQVFLKSTNGVASNTLIGTTTTDSLGNYTVQFPTSPDGVYIVQAIATNTFGSTPGPLFTFTIKTTAPTIQPTLLLSPADDTGIKGDSITATRMPHFIGVTDPFAKVMISKVVNGVRVPPVLATATADASGNFSIQLSNALANGAITLQVGVTDVAGNQGPFSLPLTVTIVSVIGDYTGAGKTTPALFRRASNGGGDWFIQGVSPVGGIPFGSANLDIPFTGDFDGDGVSDLAVYRPSTNVWFINRSKLGLETFALGAPGTIPAVGDFDGDGVTDTAAYNATTGVWTIAESTAGLKTVTLDPTKFTPKAGDVPVPGDYDGTGKDEPAVYRPSSGQFFIQSPGGSPGTFTVTTIGLTTGSAGDIPVPGNYDDALAVHETEVAVFNPSTGKYLIHGVGGDRTIVFTKGDIPAPGDYLGDGQTQPAVYRPSTAQFVVNNSGAITTYLLGKAGDVPVTSPLVYRNVVAIPPTLALDPASDTGIAGDNVTSNHQPFFIGKTDPNALVDLVDANNNVLGTGAANATGNFRVQLSPSAALADGTYVIQARAHGPVSSTGPLSPAITLKLVTVTGDYNGDGKTDPTVFRRTGPFVAQWFSQNSALLNGKSFGAGSLDVPLAGDFDGDGKVDLAVYRPSTGQWFVADSSTSYTGQLLVTFGWAGVDVPIPGNYTGTGKATPAVYRPTTGEFFVLGQPTSTIVVPGNAGDVPVPGNYDNTGKDEFALFRPSTGQWFIAGPTGTHTITFGGVSSDIPVPGAYNATTTSQAIEPALWKPSTGQFLIDAPSGTRTVQFAAGDIPAPGDYDGIGVTEPAVYRPSTGQWLVMGPNDRAPRVFNAGYGGPKDIPPIAPYSYRALGSSTGTTSSSVHALNFGATALSLSTGSVSAALSLTPAPAAAPVSVAPVVNFNARPRPKQAAPAKHPVATVHHLLNEHVASKKGHGLIH
jgi:large repetitive protein